MKRFFLNFFQILFLFIFFHHTSFSAQDSTVVIDNAIIRKEPKDKSPIIEYLPAGVEVRISSYPLEGGWYKIRASNGEYGWIHESYLSVPKTQYKVSEIDIESEQETKEAAEVVPKPIKEKKFFLRGAWGAQFGYALDINEVFQFNEFRMINLASLETGYRFFQRFSLILRTEMLYKDVVAKEMNTLITYNVRVRSYPVTFGIEYHLIDKPIFKLNLDALVGLAFSTYFETQALSLNPPNSVRISSNPFTFILKANATRPLGRTFLIFCDIGYRYLVTPELSTIHAVEVNGGQVFIRSNTYKNRIIDLSGVFGTLGIGVRF